MTGYDIIDFYNATALDLRPRASRYARRNKKAVAQAEKFLTWCSKNGVDAKLYVKALLAWCHAVNREFIPIGFLKRGSYLDKWREFGEGVALEQARTDELHIDLDRPTVSSMKLRPHREKFKAAYTGREQICLRLPQHSGGFHSQSEHCLACPVAPSCKAQAQPEP